MSQHSLVFLSGDLADAHVLEHLDALSLVLVGHDHLADGARLVGAVQLDGGEVELLVEDLLVGVHRLVEDGLVGLHLLAPAGDVVHPLDHTGIGQSDVEVAVAVFVMIALQEIVEPLLLLHQPGTSTHVASKDQVGGLDDALDEELEPLVLRTGSVLAGVLGGFTLDVIDVDSGEVFVEEVSEEIGVLESHVRNP